MAALALHSVGGLAVRALLHSSPAADGPDQQQQGGGGEDHAYDEAPLQSAADDTRALRIAAVFIILAAGIVGSLPCLFFPVFRSTSHWLPRVLRAFSAGIILALALVHIFPEAVEELGQLTELMDADHPYNVAGPCAILGAIIMVVFESAANYFVEQRQAKAAEEQLQQKQQGHNLKAVAEATEAAIVLATQQGGGHASQLVLDPHTHACMGQARMSLEATPMPRARDQILAVLFELGCIFHSFIIGLTLGVNTDNFSSVRGLVIALSFHQWLEGIALASFIMRAHIGPWKAVAMILTYSLTCPVGIAVGIGIADSYNPESTRAIATQGVLNALSSGMLLYIALVQLIAEDFTRRELPCAPAPPASSPSSALPVLPSSPSTSSPLMQPQHSHAHAHDDDAHAHGHGHGDCHASALPSPHKHTTAGAGSGGGAVTAVHVPVLLGGVCGGHGHAHGAHGAGHQGGGGRVLAASHLALLLGAALMSMLGIWA